MRRKFAAVLGFEDLVDDDGDGCVSLKPPEPDRNTAIVLAFTGLSVRFDPFLGENLPDRSRAAFGTSMVDGIDDDRFFFNIAFCELGRRIIAIFSSFEKLGEFLRRDAWTGSGTDMLMSCVVMEVVFSSSPTSLSAPSAAELAAEVSGPPPASAATAAAAAATLLVAARPASPALAAPAAAAVSAVSAAGSAATPSTAAGTGAADAGAADASSGFAPMMPLTMSKTA